jgi:hypothetical protein
MQNTGRTTSGLAKKRRRRETATNDDSDVRPAPRTLILLHKSCAFSRTRELQYISFSASKPAYWVLYFGQNNMTV